MHAPAQLHAHAHKGHVPYCATVFGTSLIRATRLTHYLEMDEYAQARCRIAENAALLSCLTEQVAAPEENTHATRDTATAFTLRRETQIVDHLAFISSTKDDPNGVTAVCMEIDRDGAGVTFRLAANSGCLSHIVRGFQGIADIMMRAARHG